MNYKVEKKLLSLHISENQKPGVKTICSYSAGLSINTIWKYTRNIIETVTKQRSRIAHHAVQQCMWTDGFMLM